MRQARHDKYRGVKALLCRARRGEQIGETVARYAFGLATLCVGVTVAWALRRYIASAVYAPLFGAVALSVWFGGTGPGVTVVAGGAVLSVYFLLAPLYEFTPSENDVWHLLVFVVAAGLIVGLGRLHHGAREVAERKRQDLERLQSLTALLLAVNTREELAATFADRAASAVGATGGALARLADDGAALEIVAPMGWAHIAVGPGSRLPIDAGMALTEAARLGRPVEFGDRAELEAASTLGAGMMPTARSAIGVPLVGADGAVTGSLAFFFLRDGAIDDDVRSLVTSVGLLCQEAVRRIDLLHAERRARLHTERLQGLTTALAAAMTEEDVFDVAVRKLGRVTNASRVIGGVLLHGGQIQVVRRTGASNAYSTGRAIIPADDTDSAVAEAIRGSAPVWVSTREEFEQRYPEIADRHPGARGAAALPLCIAGRAVGALFVVLDDESLLGAELRSLLLAIADQCSQALDRVRLYQEQRYIAQTLQKSLLPETLPVVPGLDLASAYLPAGDAYEVGGDFYDAFPTEHGLVLVVGDVCGKGPRAARLTALCRYTLRAAAIESPAPARLMTVLHRALLQQQGDETEFATVVCALLRREADAIVVSVVSAGHPPLLVRHADRSVEAVKALGSPVGTFEGTTYEETSVVLREGDALFAYTDGVTEARRDGRLFGEERLRLALAAGGSSANDLIEAVENSLMTFLEDSDFSDDVAMLAVAVAARPDEPE